MKNESSSSVYQVCFKMNSVTVLQQCHQGDYSITEREFS